MMDDFGIYERMNCYENLKIFARIYGIDDSCIKTALEKVGLWKSAKTPAKKLSKGMKGRLHMETYTDSNRNTTFDIETD